MRRPSPGERRLFDLQRDPEVSPVSRAVRAASTRSATSIGSSCSQALTTNHPMAVSCASVSRSRATLRSSFGAQYDAFAVGAVPCSGQRCQKQPSTKRATRLRVNTASGCVHLRSPSLIVRRLRKRRPRRCKMERTIASGDVPHLRFPRITEEAAGELGCGHCGSDGFTGASRRQPGVAVHVELIPPIEHLRLRTRAGDSRLSESLERSVHQCPDGWT